MLSKVGFNLEATLVGPPNRQVVFREKRSQMILGFGVYISGKDMVIHRNRQVRQYSKVGFEN